VSVLETLGELPKRLGGGILARDGEPEFSAHSLQSSEPQGTRACYESRCGTRKCRWRPKVPMKPVDRRHTSMPVKSFLGPVVRCLAGPGELPKRLDVRRSLLGRAACRTS
jgi:hypothetical protein